jgi:hypothetical protein
MLEKDKKRGRTERPPQVRSVAWVSACSAYYRPQATLDSVDNGSPPRLQVEQGLLK